MPAVKFTRYFEAARQRPDRAAIRLEWIERVIANPVHEVIRQMVAFGVGRRSPKWTGVICALILLSDGATVYNAFFDRSFQP